MSPTSNRIASWNTALSSKPGNFDLHISIDQITGTVPMEIRTGRLLSNGPGWNKYDDKVIHPFDGHGYLRSFSFNPDGSVDLKARFVETASYAIESESNTFSVRGFATNPSDKFWENIGYTIPRNVANTTVYRWGDQLIAGWEGGEPHGLDPVTLQTNGTETFNGLLEGKTTLAHMYEDSVDQTMILVNIEMGRYTGLNIHEIDKSHNCVRTRTAEIPHMAFIHDFMFSENWVIFGGNKLSIRPWGFAKQLMGSGTILNAIKTNPNAPGELILVPRRSSDPIRRIKLPKASYVVHFVNAFEQSDGTLIVDVCVFHDFPFGEEFGYSGRNAPFDPYLPEKRETQQLYRITVPPDTDVGTWVPLSQYGIDFPRVPQKEYGQNARYMVGATRADELHSDPFDSIIVIDLHNPEHPSKLWTAPNPDTTFVGEPIIASDSEMGTEHILVLLSNGVEQQTTLNIFDANNIDEGPVCSIPMPLLPVAFHGEWDPVGTGV